MQGPSRGPRTFALVLMILAVTAFAVGCGGSSGSQGGDRKGTDSAPVILGLQTPLGVQGTRGVGPNVAVIYHIRDRQFDPADIEVEYGVDYDGDQEIAEDEYKPATPSPAGGDGTSGLGTSPGPGTVHSFRWDSLTDVVTGRYMTQDYVYTDTGRVAVDGYGDPVFQNFPGVKLRMRPTARGNTGAWTVSDSFDLNNNNKPYVEVGDVVIPPEGLADGTVNEQVVLDWTAYDPDGDSVTIAVDWAQVPAGYDPGTKTPEELEGLPWNWATSGSLGEGTAHLTATRTGTAHQYAWDSAADAGTMNGWILLRIRPIDEKLEVGAWVVMKAPFHLDNYTIFTDPEAELPEARMGGRAVLLPDETVLILGGRPSATGTPVAAAAIFFPGLSQTTKGTVAELPAGLNDARSEFTATRLLDGRVLIAGGMGTAGTAIASAEIYDPVAKTFTKLASGLATARSHHTAVLLRSGNVLFAGGVDASGNLLSSAEIYDHESGTFKSADSLWHGARTDARGVLLPDGRVLIAGGRGPSGSPAEVEIYEPWDDTFTATDLDQDMSRGRNGMTLTPTLDATQAAVAAGGMASAPAKSLESFDWTKDTWTLSSAQMREGRAWHAGILLGDGKILLAGGQSDEAGTLTVTADIYDVATDTMDLPNGDMPEAVKDTAHTILRNGRPVFCGGQTASGATKKIVIFTPDGGFNYPPIAQIRTPTATEPWSFGVRFYWRAIDAEGDNVRVVGQYRIKPSDTDDSGLLSDDIKDKWLPAMIKPQTVLGEKSSGLTALSSRSDYVDPVDNPIDAPDVDPGEHLFIWFTEKDIPKGDYDNVFFRIFVYGATEGTTATSGRFSISKNAPVIARIQKPLNTWGHIVFPYYLQDSDKGDLARVDWEFGVDKNGDGKIVEADGEVWKTCKHSEVDVTLSGTTYSDAGDTDLVSGSEDPDPNNEYTDEDGIPWGKKHFLVWDSVYDLGAPVSPRTDVIIRATPYDYPPGHPADESLGIAGQYKSFTLEQDPNGLYLTKWYPQNGNTADVKTDEPIVFEFTQPVDKDSLSRNSIQVYKGSGAVRVEGYFAVDNSSGKGIVTFYPQAQEIPARTDVLEDSTTYSINIPAYDPANRGAPVVQKDGVSDKDTNQRNFLETYSAPNAFTTGVGVLADSAAPGYESLLVPAGTVNVATNSKITVVIDDRLMPSSVTPDSFQVVARAFTGVDSVVPGTFQLRNIVDESTGTLRMYAELTFVSTMPLPPDTTTIAVLVRTGLRDLAGNHLAASATPTFTTAASTETVSGSKEESFDDTTLRDENLTTAFWGTADPKSKGSAIGTGKAGYLTGLYDGGDGSDGTPDFSGGDVTLTSSSSKSLWQYKSLVIPSGRKLILKGTKPITIRVQKDVTVNGTIEGTGGNGSNGYNFSSSTSKQDGAKGGKAAAGGGDGGDCGQYAYKQSTAVDGGPGYNYLQVKGGTGAGGGGSGSRYVSGSYSYYACGGGGAGHANAGSEGKGYTGYGQKHGTGGKAYGKATLADGPEGGSGGGAGGGSIMYYSSWYGGASGGGGGAGGAGLKLALNGKLTIAGSGKVLAAGGKGGNGIRGYAWTTVYPAGGGGGSGGSIHVQAASLSVSGEMNVLGGKGGSAGYTYSSTTYQNPGGAGSDGRMVVEVPGFSGKKFSGVLSVGTTTVSCGGTGTIDWIVTANTVVNTDNGFGAPAGTYSSGKFSVKDFKLAGGATLTVQGTKPLIIYASGNAEVSGTILLPGSAGARNSTSHYSSSSGYRFNLAAAGKAGPGGFKGGDNGGSSSYSKTIAKATDGYGSNNKPGGPGGGKAGQAPSTPYKRSYSSYYYYYYYYSGAGGGGGSAKAGSDGVQYYSYGGVKGTPGKGGAAIVTPSTLSDTNILGGAGGGGGGNGGYQMNWYSSSYSPSYYAYGPGAAGGGGGGALFLCTTGTMQLSGTVDAHGGAGGSCPESGSYAWWPGPGGGGGGGNVVLIAKGGFQWGIMTIDCSGGAGGTTTYGSTVYSRGGAGGSGAIVLKSATMPVVPGDVTGLKYGTGTFQTGNFQPTKLGISLWIDSGAVAPTFLTAAIVDNGQAKLFLEGAQTSLDTLQADESNSTGWIEITGGAITQLNGYRWFRFKAELLPGDLYPEVASVKVTWQYKK